MRRHAPNIRAPPDIVLAPPDVFQSSRIPGSQDRLRSIFRETDAETKSSSSSRTGKHKLLRP